VALPPFCAIIETSYSTVNNSSEKDAALVKVNYKHEKRQKELDKKKKKDEKNRRKQERKNTPSVQNTELPKET
jgi:hypothetical protein